MVGVCGGAHRYGGLAVRLMVGREEAVGHVTRASS